MMLPLFPHQVRISVCAVFFITGISLLYLNYPDSISQGKVKGVSSTTQSLPINTLPIQSNTAKTPRFAARHVIAVDHESGRVLVSQQADTVVPIASMAKLMTAIVALEHYRLDDIVTLSKESVSTNGSLIFLKSGEKISVESLLYGLLMQSGNDAAEALASHIGVRDIFLQLMNQKAQEIGARSTHFADPSGLSNETTSTASDMALIARYSLHNPKIVEIAKTPQRTITSIDGKVIHNLENSNRLVKEEMYYEGVKLGKTGFTPEAGHNLAVAVERDNHMVITVVINTHESTNSASAEVTRDLLDWVFSNYEWITM